MCGVGWGDGEVRGVGWGDGEVCGVGWGDGEVLDGEILVRCVVLDGEMVRCMLEGEMGR